MRQVNQCMTQKYLSTAKFYAREGRVVLATNRVFHYQLRNDEFCIVHNKQQLAVSRDYQRVYKQMLIAEGKIADGDNLNWNKLAKQLTE